MFFLSTKVYFMTKDVEIQKLQLTLPFHLEKNIVLFLALIIHSQEFWLSQKGGHRRSLRSDVKESSCKYLWISMAQSSFLLHFYPYFQLGHFMLLRNTTLDWCHQHSNTVFLKAFIILRTQPFLTQYRRSSKLQIQLPYDYLTSCKYIKTVQKDKRFLQVGECHKPSPKELEALFCWEVPQKSSSDKCSFIM